jgi:WhiB family redox-sensing transcriptional regulator
VTRSSAHATSSGDWREAAACRGEDPERWFPHASAHAGIADAKAVCAGCVVRTECLQWAIVQRMKHGVWGGLTETERDTHRRRELKRRKKARRE